MKLIQLLKETRLFMAEIRRCAKYIDDRRRRKAKSSPPTAHN